MKTLKKTYSKNNNEISLLEVKSDRLFDYADKNSAKAILIIGVFHGDEPQGKFLIENYLNSEKEKVFKNRLLFIPCLNPDGLSAKTRQNSNNVDLNRNFATKNWQLGEKNEFFGGEAPASEIETKFLQEIIDEYSPDIILTLHAPFKVVNYDGPAESIAERIAEIISYPVQSDIGYHTPGSFGTYAGIEKNIPTITLELDEQIDMKELITPCNKIFDYLSNI